MLTPCNSRIESSCVLQSIKSVKELGKETWPALEMHGHYASIEHLDSQGILLGPLWDVVARDQNDHQPSSHAVDHHLTHKYTFTHITLHTDFLWACSASNTLVTTPFSINIVCQT